MASVISRLDKASPIATLCGEERAMIQPGEAGKNAAEFAASLDQAARDLDRHGPVSRDDLAAMLQDLEDEWERKDAGEA